MFGGGIRFGWGSGRWLIRPMVLAAFSCWFILQYVFYYACSFCFLGCLQQCVHARFSGVRGSPVADLLPEMLAGLAAGSAVSLLQLCEGNSVGHSRGLCHLCTFVSFCLFLYFLFSLDFSNAWASFHVCCFFLLDSWF
jgi:hypothetical protein